MSDQKLQSNAPSQQKMVDKTQFVEPSWSVPEQACACASRCWLMCPCVCCAAQTEVKDYERGVLLRFGRQVHAGTISGGMHFLLPSVEEMLKIDCREQLLDIPKQKVYTKDGYALTIDAVLYFKVFDASKALLSIQDVRKSIFLVSQTKLREILGIHTYQQIQIERKSMIASLKMVLDEATDPWGIDVTRVEMTEIYLPMDMQNAIAAEATARVSANASLIAADRDAKARMIQASASPVLVNAEREAKARVILAQADAQSVIIRARAQAEAKELEADGELKAAHKLKDAAAVMQQVPSSMQLRYMQTLPTLKGTIVIPMDPGMSSLASIGAAKMLSA